MRILLFSSTYRPVVGGVETVTDRLARELARRHHEISVMTNRYPRSLAARETVDGIEVERRLFPNIVPSPGRRTGLVLLKQVLSLPLAAVELARFVVRLRRTCPDVVWVHYVAYPAVYACVASWFARAPIVLSFHGSDVPSCPYPSTYSWLARAMGRLATVITCNSADLAGYLEQDLRRVDRAKVQVIPFGIDDWAGPDAVGAELEELFILLAARLVPKKGVDIAIRAMEVFADTEPDGGPIRDICLKIAGAGPLEAELRTSVADLGQGDRVQFLGELRPSELRKTIRESRFVLVPSHWEAFGVVALEAMIASKAVVATSAGGIAEVVRDQETGVLVPPGDALALAKAMKTLAERPEVARSMGAAGRERALTEYSWSVIGDQFETLLTSVRNVP